MVQNSIGKKIEKKNEQLRLMTTTCGVCDFSKWNPSEIRNCTVCEKHLCISIQKGPRSVCSYCILKYDPDEIFQRSSDGRLIDQGTGLPSLKFVDTLF